VLTETVQRALAYGEPGFGETPDRDVKEIFYSLQLAAPIYFLGGDDSDQPAEPSIRQLQIAFINDKSLPGASSAYYRNALSLHDRPSSYEGAD